MLWQKSGSRKQHQVLERLEAGSQRAVLPWQLWCLVDGNSRAPRHQAAAHTENKCVSIYVHCLHCILHLHSFFISIYYYYNIRNNNRPRVPGHTGSSGDELILLCCVLLYQHQYSRHSGPSLFFSLSSLLLSPILSFLLFLYTDPAVHHLPKARLIPYRTGTISDPADKPSVQPSRSGIWSIQPGWMVDVAAVVSHIDWNNGSAFGSQWTHCTSSMTTEVSCLHTSLFQLF